MKIVMVRGCGIGDRTHQPVFVKVDVWMRRRQHCVRGPNDGAYFKTGHSDLNVLVLVSLVSMNACRVSVRV